MDLGKEYICIQPIPDSDGTESMAWHMYEKDDVAAPLKEFGGAYTSWAIQQPLGILKAYIRIRYPEAILVSKGKMLALHTLCGCQMPVTRLGSNLCNECWAELDSWDASEMNDEAYEMWKSGILTRMMGSKELTRNWPEIQRQKREHEKFEAHCKTLKPGDDFYSAC